MFVSLKNKEQSLKNRNCVYYYKVVNYKFVMSHVIDKKVRCEIFLFIKFT